LFPALILQPSSHNAAEDNANLGTTAVLKSKQWASRGLTQMPKGIQPPKGDR